MSTLIIYRNGKTLNIGTSCVGPGLYLGSGL